jgi:undecaprenyl diphosphate synthase
MAALEEGPPMTRHSGRHDEPAGSANGGLHVAIIMDGNGRWAKSRGLPRTLGHRAGVAALRRTVESAPELGIDRLTVFGFSTENWSRPKREVSELMGLLKAYFQSDIDRLEREGVQVRIVGRRSGLDPDILDIVERAEARTARNRRFILQVAFNYGGRADIVDAARRLLEAQARGEITAETLTEARFEGALSTAPAPAPDLIIRTSGEQRLSNFLLWECAYAELVFQDVYWPDYGAEPLRAALAEFETRQRRYGGVVADDILAAG